MVPENQIAFKRALSTFKENISWSGAYNSKRSYLVTKKAPSSPTFWNVKFSLLRFWFWE